MNKWNSTKVHNPKFRRELDYNNLGSGPTPGGSAIEVLNIADMNDGGSYDMSVTIERDGYLVGSTASYVDRQSITINGEEVDGEGVTKINAYRAFNGYMFNKYPVKAGDTLSLSTYWGGGGRCTMLIYLV